MYGYQYHRILYSSTVPTVGLPSKVHDMYMLCQIKEYINNIIRVNAIQTFERGGEEEERRRRGGGERGMRRRRIKTRLTQSKEEKLK